LNPSGSLDKYHDVSLSHAVSYKQAVEVLKENGSVDQGLLRHVFPLGWEHINVLGEFIDDNSGLTVDRLQPLRVEASD
jgi:hypothetical protein